MTQTLDPQRLAADLAAAAEQDMQALERNRAQVDAHLSKMSADDQLQFKAELSRLLRRNEITKARPSFRRDWANSKR